MGFYTVLDDKRVDDTIARDLNHIVERVTKALPASEVILGGGFGRGEGSVLVKEDVIRPVNDYDIFIVVPDDCTADFRAFGKELAGEIQIRLLDLIPIKHSSLSSLPATQFNYDLRYGSRHLWGDNLLETIPRYKEGFVDHESGRTLLLNRLICAIEAFSEDFEFRNMTTEERFFLVNQTGKIVSSCIESLLIRRNRYHHSYRKRQETFEALFPKKESLKQLNKRATEFKLRPSMSPDFDAVAYWKEAVYEYVNVISDYLTPGFIPPVYRLWKKLRKKNCKLQITNTLIERVELMLLLYRESSFITKKGILSKAHNELEAISKTRIQNGGWENLRGITARLWHELYH
ncbi:MAG: hypothetical protein A2149_02990 [Candidatus Schekmanbacteria bacterium RBG_16_38_11]|uniref:Uncharacterized protein n=1 Tax=Candidatus Schekmanbacteria bacterium RBG_16_38_11 TaxID=1817880 RepID=A0A1F7RR21_9BACT|nr:MAG: hypothetical protein A2149_02990 [Candidatus Schekmanbacteria bacterium RBG_16_38_11]